MCDSCPDIEIQSETRECGCGGFIVTNDPYMIDAWNEWHEEGAFLAGKYHGSQKKTQSGGQG